MKSLRTIAIHLAAALAVVILALPFFWMLSTSLKPMSEVLQQPPSLLSSELHWQSYREAWQAAPFGRFYLNSLLVGVAAAALQVLLALLMAYAFAWIAFPAKHALLIAVLATMIIPDETRLVPNYLLLAKLNWLDTYWALIIPTVANAFPVFVLYQQFRILPRALLEAAKADGAGHFRTLWHVAAPLGRPVLAAVALVVFLGRWNDFLWPLTVTNTVAMRTLPIGLAYLQQVEEAAARWNVLMAGTVLVIMPLLALYVLAQRQFIEGITRGALKG